MNKSYTLVWNQATGCWNVASEGTRRRSKSGRGKALVVAGASLLGLFCQAPAFALPSGATVVSGDAGFQTSTDGRHMVIDQQSHKLITNWNEFSVRADERVSFHQPGQDAVALNRVIGRNGSDIQGRIDANGKVFLVNPNGVVFGKSAQVNVGGLVASTLDLADRDFLAGNYQFSGDSGATVSNAGSLQASEGGSIALLGARVSNDGVIQAQLGDVALGAGQGINLNFDGDGLLNLQVDKGSVDALAHNGGLIRADGGQVLMSARSADSLLKTVVNNQGTLEARTLRSAEGRIVLDGGEQGTVRVAGKQDASAIGGGNGGLVLNQGANVEIQRTAQVDTHADQGATGTWRILSHEVSVAAVGQANAAGDGSGQVHVAQGPAGANASDSNGVTIVQQQPAVDLAAGANGTSAVQSQSGANGISVVQSQNSPNIGSGASGITVVQSQNGANIGSGASGISVVQSQSGPSIGSGVNGVTIVQSQSGANIGPGVSGIDVVQTQTLPNLSPGANGSSIVQVQTLPDIAADAGNVHVVQVQTGGNKVFGNSATNVRSRTVQARSSENVGSGLANPSSAGKGPTLHADTLARNLSTSNVEVVATRGNAHVGAPLSWDSGNGLTLTAERGDLRINGALTAQGENASLTLNAGQRPLRIDDSLSLTGQGARVEFNSDKGYALAEGARITLSGKNAGFRANGRDYSVIQDLQQLRGIDRDLGGSYVLGNRIAGGHSSFLSIGNASAFGGTFDGLGNTIDNLAVYGTGAYSGLFSVNRGTLRNLNLERISADGAQATHYNVQVGSLAAVNLGRIDNVNASDIRIAAASQLNSLGGLVALNLGSIDNASASGTLVGNRQTYALGGLAAENISTARGVASISNSRADFAISGQLKDHASHYGAGGPGRQEPRRPHPQQRQSGNAVAERSRDEPGRTGRIQLRRRTGGRFRLRRRLRQRTARPVRWAHRPQRKQWYCPRHGQRQGPGHRRGSTGRADRPEPERGHQQRQRPWRCQPASRSLPGRPDRPQPGRQPGQRQCQRQPEWWVAAPGRRPDRSQRQCLAGQCLRQGQCRYPRSRSGWRSARRKPVRLRHQRFRQWRSHRRQRQNPGWPDRVQPRRQSFQPEGLRVGKRRGEQ